MNEVSEMVKLQSGSAPSSTALDQMMAQFDTNADGAINLDEYLNVIFGKGWSVGTPLVTIKPSAVDAAAGLRAKFDSIDKDKTGSIDAAEFGDLPSQYTSKPNIFHCLSRSLLTIFETFSLTTHLVV